MGTGNFDRDGAGIARRLDVAVTIADNVTSGRFDAQRSSGIEDELWFGLSALARIVRSMRAYEKAFERSEQLVDAAVDRVDLLGRDVTAADAALIADHGEPDPRSAKTIEQRTRVRRRLDAIGIAVERNVDDDRLIAVEQDGSGRAALANFQVNRSRSTPARRG